MTKLFVLLSIFFVPLACYAQATHLACRVSAAGIVLEASECSGSDDPAKLLGALGPGERAVTVPYAPIGRDQEALRLRVPEYELRGGTLHRRENMAQHKLIARRSEYYRTKLSAAQAAIQVDPNDAEAQASATAARVALQKLADQEASRK